MQRIVPLTNMPGFDVPYVQEKLMEERNWELARKALASLPEIHQKVVKLRLAKNSWIAIAFKLDITNYMAKKYYREAMRTMKTDLVGKINA